MELLGALNMRIDCHAMTTITTTKTMSRGEVTRANGNCSDDMRGNRAGAWERNDERKKGKKGRNEKREGEKEELKHSY